MKQLTATKIKSYILINVIHKKNDEDDGYQHSVWMLRKM